MQHPALTLMSDCCGGLQCEVGLSRARWTTVKLKISFLKYGMISVLVILGTGKQTDV